LELIYYGARIVANSVQVLAMLLLLSYTTILCPLHHISTLEILSIPFTCTHPSVQSVTVTVFPCLPYTVLLFSYSAFIRNTLYRSLHNFFALFLCFVSNFTELCRPILSGGKPVTKIFVRIHIYKSGLV